MNKPRSEMTKTDCLLYDKEKDTCKALKELYCAKCRQCNFYKKGTEQPKKKKAW